MGELTEHRHPARRGRPTLPLELTEKGSPIQAAFRFGCLAALVVEALDFPVLAVAARLC